MQSTEIESRMPFAGLLALASLLTATIPLIVLAGMPSAGLLALASLLTATIPLIVLVDYELGVASHTF
jgi:hypothetical protein